MTGKISRHDALTDAAPEQPSHDPALCPCCAEPLRTDRPDGPTCDQCHYPRNSAAWVDYDGCC